MMYAGPVKRCVHCGDLAMLEAAKCQRCRSRAADAGWLIDDALTAFLNAFQFRLQSDEFIRRVFGGPNFVHLARGQSLPILRYSPVTGFNEQNNVPKLNRAVSVQTTVMSKDDALSTQAVAVIRSLLDTHPLELANGQVVAPQRGQSHARKDSLGVLHAHDDFHFRPARLSGEALRLLKREIQRHFSASANRSLALTALCEPAAMLDFGTPLARYHVVSAPEDRDWPVEIQFSIFAANAEDARVLTTEMLALAASFSFVYCQPSSLGEIVGTRICALQIGFQHYHAAAEEITAAGELLHHCYFTLGFDVARD